MQNVCRKLKALVGIAFVGAVLSGFSGGPKKHWSNATANDPEAISRLTVIEDRVNGPDIEAKPYLVLISLDAFRADYMDLYRPPVLEKLRVEGVAVPFMLPVFPSKTFTNHWSIVTGLYANHHGILGNTFYDRNIKGVFKHSYGPTAEDARWYAGEPIWVTAEKQGMLSGTFFWPGSGAAHGQLKPTYTYHYSGAVGLDARVSQLHDWLELPKEKRPHLMTFYFPDVDTNGHRHGPNSKEVKTAVENVDRTVGKMLEEIGRSPLPINLVVVSDHGLLLVDPAKIEYLDEYTDLSQAQVLGRGSQALIYLKEDVPGDKKSRLAKIYRDLTQKAKHFKVYYPDQIPASWHFAPNTHLGDLVVDVEAPYEVGLRNPPAPPEIGSHGWNPDKTPEMRAVFFAKGPQIKAQMKIQPFRNVHLYPWLVRMLGLKMPATPVDGDLKVLAPLLKDLQ